MFAIGLTTSAACAGCTVTGGASTFTLGEAERALWPGARQVAYRSPTEEQRRALAELIGTLWAGIEPGPAPALDRLATRAGLLLELWTIGGRPTWVVREAASDQHGLGIYLIHAAPMPRARPILLQAPHAYFDYHTQSIAAAMFWASDASPEIRGLFTNSVHRFQVDDGVRGKVRFNSADVAHNVDHPFQTATGAVLDRGPVVVLQMHGFDGRNLDPSITAIVSAARADGSTDASSAVAATLATTLGVPVSRFPEDVAYLGGLDNVQGRLVATSPTARFIHVELELPQRRRLRDPGLAASWARLLVDRLGAPRTP